MNKFCKCCTIVKSYAYSIKERKFTGVSYFTVMLMILINIQEGLFEISTQQYDLLIKSIIFIVISIIRLFFLV